MAHVGHTGAIAVVGVSTEDQVLAPLGAQTMMVAIGGVILVLIGGHRHPGLSREELVHATTSAEEEVARLTRLTNDLLILAHTDEGMLPVKSAPTRVRDLLERSADRAAGRAAPAAVVVEATSAPLASVP